jgi:hypothetical protein
MAPLESQKVEGTYAEAFSMVGVNDPQWDEGEF